MSEIGGDVGKQPRQLAVGDGNVALIVRKDDAFAGTLDRVHEADFSRLRAGFLARHLPGDAFLHDLHGMEKRARLVLPARRNFRLEFSFCDAIGNECRGKKRTHDAPRQEDRDRSCQQQRKHRHTDDGVFEPADMRDRLAPADKAVIGVEFDQKVELIEDVLVERR
jgi:hypothetical protein